MSLPRLFGNIVLNSLKNSTEILLLIILFLVHLFHLVLELLGLGGRLRLLLGVPVALRLTLQPLELSLDLPDALTTLTSML